MEIGDVVRTKEFKNHFINSDGKGWVQYKAPNGKRFVLMILGIEPGKNGNEFLNPEKILNDMGWIYSPKVPEEE
jgi:hypothetical protein